MMPARNAAIAVLLAATCLVCSGCNIVGPAFYMIRGPDKVKKVHTLDKNRTTVVVIDDRANRVPRRALRVLMGDVAERTMLKEKVVKDMVSSQSALAAAASDRDGKPLSVAEIGEAVQAQVVVYATVDSFSISPDGTTLSPTVVMRVRVVDVAKDERIWPEDPAGHRVVTRMAARVQTMPTSTTGRYQVEDDLAKRAGLELAQLFFDHAANQATLVPE
ncbi:MAG: hypothetical protein KF678_10320 [Phycisphaeraceae bacterium]|nr:hypothetical protein [Phycisphaeraceae bacterium]